MKDLLKEAINHYERSEWSESLNLVSKTIITDSVNAEAYLLRANIYCKMQQWGNAINDYNSVLELNPGNKEATVGIQMAKNILGYFTPDMFNP